MCAKTLDIKIIGYNHMDLLPAGEFDINLVIGVF